MFAMNEAKYLFLSAFFLLIGYLDGVAAENSNPKKKPSLVKEEQLRLQDLLQRARECKEEMREEYLLKLKSRKKNSKNKDTRYLIDCVIAEVLLTRRHTGDKRSFPDASLKLKEIRKEYPEMKKDGYLSYLELTIRAHPDNPEPRKNLLQFTKTFLKEWNEGPPNFAEFPKHLKRGTLIHARYIIAREVMKATNVPGISADEENILIAQKTLKILKDIGAPKEVIKMQEEELRVEVSIAEKINIGLRSLTPEGAKPYPEKAKNIKRNDPLSSTSPDLHNGIKSQGEKTSTVSGYYFLIAIILGVIFLASLSLAFITLKRKRRNLE